MARARQTRRRGRSLTVRIETIAHQDQRYDTCGDWWFTPDNGALEMRISALGDTRYEMLVAMHELTEALSCLFAGITTQQVDRFDLRWKPHGLYDEPGDDPKAPYHHQHDAGIVVERFLAQQWGVDWQQYEEQMRRLPTWRKRRSHKAGPQ